MMRADQRNLWRERAVAWMAMVVCVAILSGCSDGGSSKSREIGYTGTLGESGGKGVILTDSSDTLHEVMKLQKADDGTGLTNLENSGRIYVVDAGTRAKVIDVSWGTIRVRVQSGPHKDGDGWTVQEMMR